MKRISVFIMIAVFAGAVPAMAAAYDDIVPYQFSLFYPLQTSPSSTSISGLRVSLISAENEDVSGLDFGLINLVDDVQKGLQFGFYNRSFKTSGVQIGLINRTSYLDGLQIGFLNIHEEGNWRLLPLVNFSF